MAQRPRATAAGGAGGTQQGDYVQVPRARYNKMLTELQSWHGGGQTGAGTLAKGTRSRAAGGMAAGGTAGTTTRATGARRGRPATKA
jgi:hypothetical protein